MNVLDLLRRKPAAAPAVEQAVAPAVVQLADGAPFDVRAHLSVSTEGLPRMDWQAAWAWAERFAGEERKSEAWGACARAWMLHLRDALGEGYRLDDGDDAVILSSMSAAQVAAAKAFLRKTLSRVAHVLDGVADASRATRILVVLDEEDAYYRYVAQFDAEGGEYAFSSGMHIGHGLPHFVAMKAEVGALEPIVAHELTHACVSHLPLPLWLNEGLAVNTEHSLCGAGRPMLTPQEMHAKHRKFWNGETIQEFWSGWSFRRPDEGNMLSYDLARVVVEQLSADWPRFAAFVREANFEDAGAAAARAHLGVDLAAVVAAMLESGDTAGWTPEPQRWKTPETRTE